jgi:uncharacterized protein
MAGGKESRPPQDHGFMYGRSFEDPDGDIWDVFWIDPAHVKTQNARLNRQCRRRKRA